MNTNLNTSNVNVNLTDLTVNGIVVVFKYI